MQDVAAVPHEPDVLRCAVDALTVQDGPLKHVAELLPCTQEVWTHEVHHAPVLHQVVLQRVAGQHHAPPRTDVLQRLRRASMAVLYAVTLVADHHVRPGPRESLLDVWKTVTRSVMY